MEETVARLIPDDPFTPEEREFLSRIEATLRPFWESEGGRRLRAMSREEIDRLVYGDE